MQRLLEWFLISKNSWVTHWCPSTVWSFWKVTNQDFIVRPFTSPFQRRSRIRAFSCRTTWKVLKRSRWVTIFNSYPPPVNETDRYAIHPSINQHHHHHYHVLTVELWEWLLVEFFVIYCNSSLIFNHDGRLLCSPGLVLLVGRWSISIWRTRTWRPSTSLTE